MRTRARVMSGLLGRSQPRRRGGGGGGLIPTWALRWTRFSTSLFTRWRCSLMSLKCWMVSYVPMPPAAPCCWCCCAEPICFSDSWKEFLRRQNKIFHCSREPRRCSPKRTYFTVIICGFTGAVFIKRNNFRATPNKCFCHKLTCAGWKKKKKKSYWGTWCMVSFYLQRSKLSQINLLIPIHQGLHSLKVWYKKMKLPSDKRGHDC